MSSNRVHQQKVSQATRIALIKKHPFFSLLNDDDLEVFTKSLQEISLEPDEVIVNENEVLELLHIICEGQAEVTRIVSSNYQTTKRHVAFIEKGTVIGLTRTGFFSTSAFRTATVTAITPMILLTIPLVDLYQFFNKYPAFKKTCEKFLLTNFILKTDIFHTLTQSKIRQLIKKIKKVHLPIGSKLFSVHDKAEECYFILEGEVDIVLPDKTQSPITLSHGNFFGEAALLSEGRRNASAYAKSDVILFELEKKDLQKIQLNKSAIYNLKKGRLEQFTPAANQDVFLNNEGTKKEPLFFLKKNISEQKFYISNFQKKIWSAINGKNSIKDILDITPAKQDAILNFILSLDQAHFIYLPAAFHTLRDRPLSWLKRIKKNLFNAFNK